MKDSKVTWLENGGTRLGILPDVGGRIVFLGKDGSGNLLKSDPALWDEPDSLRPDTSIDAPWKEYNGHTVWLGPQGAWWMHQDLHPGRRDAKAVWPPDPWLIYGDYAVASRDAHTITLEGPESPVSGVKLTKTYKVDDSGRVKLRVVMTNIREEPVSWDIWMNTRVDGYSDVYVPVTSAVDVRVDGTPTETKDTVAYEIRDGYFRFVPRVPSEGKSNRNSKAFITPSKPWMAGFIGDHCLVIGFDLYDIERTHPDQGMVEIYNATTMDPEGALTEMEYHGPFVTLQPGESTELVQEWQVLNFDGNPGDQISFLNGI